MKSVIFLNLAVVACVSTACQRQDMYTVPVVEETYVHKYGVEVPSYDWQERGQNGQVITTLGNGVLVTKNYSNGILDRDSTYSFPHSNAIEKVETYDQNKLIKTTLNYPSGATMQEVDYASDGSRGIVSWYENGASKSVEELNPSGMLIHGEYRDQSGKLDSQVDNSEGTRTVRDNYGQLVSRDTIQNGMMTLSSAYHPNGTPSEVIPYRNGAIEGQHRTYLPAGEPNTVGTWVDGKQNGITIVYKNGEKFAEVPYVNGMKNGVERRYRDGNILIEEICWKNDQKHGPDKVYIGGNNVQTSWFYDGQPMSEDKYLKLIARPF